MNIKFNKNNRKMRKNKEKTTIVQFDFSFILLFVLMIFLDEILLYFYFAIFISIHELCHFFVAKKLGYLPKKIHFTFFGAALEGYDDFLFDDEIKIILAGPFFNFLVVILCYLSFWFCPESFVFLNDILLVNLSILIFNLLPVFPLDFGRIILAILSKKYFRFKAVKKVKVISFVAIILLFVLFLMSFFFEYNFTLGFVIINLARLSFLNGKDTAYKRDLFALKKLKTIQKGLIEKTVYVSNEVEYFKLFKFIDDSHFFNFVFIDKNGLVCDKISEIDLYHDQNLI